jgi:hypothetical protein
MRKNTNNEPKEKRNLYNVANAQYVFKKTEINSEKWEHKHTSYVNTSKNVSTAVGH